MPNAYRWVMSWYNATNSSVYSCMVDASYGKIIDLFADKTIEQSLEEEKVELSQEEIIALVEPFLVAIGKDKDRFMIELNENTRRIKSYVVQ